MVIHRGLWEKGGWLQCLLADVSFWTLQDIEVANDASEEGKRTGILLEATQSGEVVRGITIEHMHVFNVKGLTGEDNSAKDTGGIGIFAPPLKHPARFDGVLIKDCDIEHVDNVGIWLNTYPSLNPLDQAWNDSRNDHIHIIGNRISDTGRNAIIVRQAFAPLIEGNTVTHSSARHHGNAIFTRSTRDAIIRRNEVSFTGTERSGENAAFDADIDSVHTLIEYNWSHDNEGGLFSLCNNPNDDTNETEDTVVRFNVSENDGVRAFGFSGGVKHSIIYNNTVLIGVGHKAAIVEARPFSRNKPRYADGAAFFNNLVIILGEASYDFAEAKNMVFDSNCVIGDVENPFSETRTVSLTRGSLPKSRTGHFLGFALWIPERGQDLRPFVPPLPRERRERHHGCQTPGCLVSRSSSTLSLCGCYLGDRRISICRASAKELDNLRVSQNPMRY